LAIADDLMASDRAPAELAAKHGISSNLLAHHLDVLEAAGIITRSASAGDGRRKYVGLAQVPAGVRPPALPQHVLFVCTRNSARSQLAAALWSIRTGARARSAGTEPAPCVHPGAVAAAGRVGADLGMAAPSRLGRIGARTQVITVCDHAHESIETDPSWWHWSIPDPVPDGSDEVFDAVVDEIMTRIDRLATAGPHTHPHRTEHDHT
jgi:ArsR family transcriptional regulator, arsenate/arsenite/antimonite-responsive transcriptional repressor / arsenate reductase (thioredoxin)